MKKILILQGPNVNLLGLKSSTLGKRLTLSKLNKAIRSTINHHDVELKFLQTHKSFQAVNFLQRNRNKANGLLLIPTSWARNNFTIFETINLIKLNTSVIYFGGAYCFGTGEKESIFQGNHITPFLGEPISSCIAGIKHLTDK
tara:strand:- start:26 stop:454 length:429 start_codon:yes stop_codon:yes gene_type:complete